MRQSLQILSALILSISIFLGYAPPVASAPTLPPQKTAAQPILLPVHTPLPVYADAVLEESQRLPPDPQMLAAYLAIEDLVPLRYRHTVIDAAQANSLDPGLLAAVGWVESRWQADARGSSGEVGIMQIMPATGRWIAQAMGMDQPYDLRDPATNIHFAAFYLRRLLNSEGTAEGALAAYNGGSAWRVRAPTVARGYAERVLGVSATGQGE